MLSLGLSASWMYFKIQRKDRKDTNERNEGRKENMIENEGRNW